MRDLEVHGLWENKHWQVLTLMAYGKINTGKFLGSKHSGNAVRKGKMSSGYSKDCRVLHIPGENRDKRRVYNKMHVFVFNKDMEFQTKSKEFFGLIALGQREKGEDVVHDKVKVV